MIFVKSLNLFKKYEYRRLLYVISEGAQSQCDVKKIEV